jgi:FtsP/CotA-like multicopper oxidase with cupredoxin domain
LIAALVTIGYWVKQLDLGMGGRPPSGTNVEFSTLDYQGAYERVIKEQFAISRQPIPPTVTTATGDLGGKYFGQTPDPARTRHYYIAAEPEQWDFMPAGSDPVCGMPLPADVVMRHKVWKVRYIQYTDATFTKRVPQTARLGILGPALRGVVGDYLAVTFYNRVPTPLSMHPHGVKYDKDSEGSFHSDMVDQANLVKRNAQGETPVFQGKGAAVGYNAKFTYVWYLDEQSGPLPGEPSSKGWLYHSHVNPETEINRGLEGFIVVTDPARARPDGTPKDVDREMAALFMIYDENELGAEAEEQLALTPPGDRLNAWVRLQKLLEDGERHAINGYVFGNLPGLEMNEGERVRWYLFGLGSEKDFHTAHWHGLRVTEEGRRRTDVVELLPATMKVADLLAENPGDWLFHCHVEEHMAKGMFARLTVHPKGGVEVSRAPEVAFFGMPQTNSVAK